ncbi:group III truncated hemoglobin [Deinococcus radiotolerans]|nr:group III truncated hemoglobin [Deinococcus radiotolerans]
MLLSASPLPGWPDVQPLDPATLAGAAGVLLPHDGGPVADLRDQPQRWALLTDVTAALRRGVPVLGWGTGAALLGRALGARVHGAAGAERAALPRGASPHAWRGDVPLHWTQGRAVAWADPELPERVRTEFLAALPGWADRTPGSPLEEVGGLPALEAVVTEFYARARRDPLLGPVFEAHVQDWPAHLARVTAFWATMLGGRDLTRWRGNLNAAHAGLGVRGEHLQAWLALWSATAHDLLPPPAADLLTRRAGAMGARLGPRRH